MKFLIHLVLLFGVGYAAQSMLPWWSLVATSLLLGLFFYYQRSFLTFLAGFLGMGLLWLVQLYYLQALDQGGLAKQMGQLFSMDATQLTWVAAIMSAVLGGLASLTGWLFRDLVNTTVAQEKQK